MKNLVKSLFVRLQEEVPQLNYIDVDLGQTKSDIPSTGYPCALIDISEVQYTSSNWSSQLALSAVKIRLGFNKGEVSAEEEPTILLQQALQYCDVIDCVSSVLHGFGAPEFSPLVRKSMTHSTEIAPMWYVITFATQCTECLEATYRKAPVPGNIAMETEHPD